MFTKKLLAQDAAQYRSGVAALFPPGSPADGVVQCLRERITGMTGGMP